MYMTDKRKIFDWNHISDKLTKDQIMELKAYYHTYHRKCWAFKHAVKRFKKRKFLGNSLSIVFASGVLASSIASSGISLIAISTATLLIQGWMSHKNLDLKIQNCIYASQSYQYLLISIRDTMRVGDFNQSSIHVTMKNIDDYVTDNSPIVDKYLLKYDTKFSA